jgi:ATP-dependent DNA ligase
MALQLADRYPWIVEAARRVRQSRFVLDGEAVILGVDGVSDFNALHSREPAQCRPLDRRVRASHRQSNSCIRTGSAAPDKPRSRAR